MKRFILFLTAILFVFCLKAQEQQVVVPFTLADRDRIIQTDSKLGALETKMDVKFEKIDVKFESIQRQNDDLKTLFYWGFGIMITLFLFMLGYMIWDRRTAMQPALAHAANAEENTRDLIKSLREYSKKHADLAEILKSHGIL
jgi:hypothetical protein